MDLASKSANSFLRDPLSVHLYNPITASIISTYVFVGDVPGVVRGAIKSRNDRVLREYYGPRYAQKLRLGSKLGGSESLRGGKSVVYPDDNIDVFDIADDLDGRENRGGGYDDVADIEELLRAAESEEVPSAPRRPPGKPAAVSYVDSVHIFPEDKFMELKDKISIVTGIPNYRQHLFYLIDDDPRTTYRIYTDTAYPVDIRKHSGQETLGLTADMNLYSARGVMKVVALDVFQLVGNVLHTNEVYVVDLNLYTEGVRSQLRSLQHDKYRFDLIYYGFIVKFWPQLTTECFFDYIGSEADLGAKYPELVKSSSTLSYTYRHEREVLNYTYKQVALRRQLPTSFAITSVVAAMETTACELNIRNIFDYLDCDGKICELRAYVEHESKRYLLRKRHISCVDLQFPAGALMRSGLTIAIRRSADNYAYVNLRGSGQYYTKISFNEEDKATFPDVLSEVKKIVEPILRKINTGSRLLRIGGTLPTPTASTIRYKYMDVGVFWHRVLLETGFKQVKTAWEDYSKGGIIRMRQMQQFDRYELNFRKGMYDFDLSSIEKIMTAASGIQLTNNYAYLSNSTIRQKWEQNYEGRICRVVHRTTDIKFDIYDIHEKEFEVFHRIITGFISRASGLVQTTERLREDVKKLRKLREQDPELYNLKKHGSRKVYSRKCQHRRQPLIYAKDELSGLSAKEKKMLVKYWNFTLQKPAYYSCPSKEYPYLGFHVGFHPAGYCVPCCNATAPAPSSRKERITSICLQGHKYTLGMKALSTRHILSYGKDIEVGRLGRLPPGSLRRHLRSSERGTSPTENFYLYGVPQHFPGVANMGIVYALSAAVAGLSISGGRRRDEPGDEEEKRISAQVRNFLRAVLAGLRKADRRSLQTLAGGSLIDYFSTPEELCSEIESLFLRGEVLTSIPSGFTGWPELFISLASELIGVDTYVLMDGGDGKLSLYISDSLVGDKPIALILKRVNFYYPVFRISPEVFARSGEVAGRVFPRSSVIGDFISRAVKTEAPRGDFISLGAMQEFARVNGYQICLKLANRGSLCYAVILTRGGEYGYFPVDYVAVSHSSDIHYGCINDIKREGLPSPLPLPHHFAEKLLAEMGRTITGWYSCGGRVCAVASGGAVIPVTTTPASPRAPVKEIGVDYQDVNCAILARVPPQGDRRKDLLGYSLYQNYAYKLYMLGFAERITHERNEELRSVLAAKFVRGDYQLGELLDNFPNDKQRLNAIIGQVFYESLPAERGKKILAELSAGVFEFDRLTVTELRRLPQESALKKLIELSKEFAVEGQLPTAGWNFENVYLPCSEGDFPYCKGGKLVVKDIKEYASILLADIRNDLKSVLLLENIWKENIINYLSFRTSPSFIVTVYLL